MMRESELIIIGLTLLSFVFSIYFYPQLPEKIASHWNVRGQVDGYMSKFWGIFLLPLILTGLSLIFIAIPRIDPLKSNIIQFINYYDGFLILFFLFLFAIYSQMILWNLGTKITFNITAPIGLGLIFVYLGILCEKVKPNWFIGIRTPWTLSNEKVWKKTHNVGGKLFKIAGVIAFLGIIFQKFILFFVLVPVILIAGCTFIYSYFEYQKEMKS